MVVFSMQKMILMRGLPGSGKSTKARSIAMDALYTGAATTIAICSTDDFFMRNGEYQFVPRLIGDAHKWNQDRVRYHMIAQTELIIVDNTNTQAWEMKPYRDLATSMRYDVEEIVVGDEYLSNKFMAPEVKQEYVDTCHARNTHGVPREVIEKMMKRFEL